MYATLRRSLFLVPAERIHRTGVRRAARRDRRCADAAATEPRLAPVDPVLASTVFGVRFPGPLGLAAGFDKDGTGLNAWGALGFGYAEVGTVTAHAQPGNPTPRLFRLPADRALLNRMGFNNHGAAELAHRLAHHQSRRADRGQHRQDQNHRTRGCRRRLPGQRATGRAACGISGGQVSSPNTPGLRDLQTVESLRPILSAVLAETSRPVLVKIAPDLADTDIDEIADLAVELGLAGIVATNTTVSRDGLSTPGVEQLGSGGISGPPVARGPHEVLRRLYGRVGDRLTLISVGGIETVDDAWDRITAGASLLQGYTGFVYGGGLWAKHIHDGLATRLREGGFSVLERGGRIRPAAPASERPVVTSRDRPASGHTHAPVTACRAHPCLRRSRGFPVRLRDLVGARGSRLARSRAETG